MGIKKLRCLGDVEVIVKQIRQQYQVKNPRLRHYRNWVWDCIESFDAFSIEDIPRAQNERFDSLVLSASLLTPHPSFGKDKITIEMVFRLSVPDNANHWQVFNDDNQILSFLEQRDNFNNLFFEGSVNPHRESISEEEVDGINE
ncbi:hypothetical protein KI387_000237, partial [Taxus chinensis]